MKILRNVNFRRHRGVMRGLDFENMPAEVMHEGPDTTGRLSDSLYEGTSRLPPPAPTDPEPEPTAHHPVPGERPHPRAQWDDVRACWVAWDDDAGDWLPVVGER